MDASTQPNSTFNPYTQTFTLLSPDGTTPFLAEMQELLTLQHVATNQGVIYGSQVGLCASILLVLVLMTQPDKRRSLVFMLNVAALLLGVFRNILPCIELNGAFYNYYNWQLYYYPNTPAVRSSQGISVATEVINVVMDIVVYSALVLQVYIICCTMARSYRRLILIASLLVGVGVCTLRTVLAAFNCKYSVIGIRSYTVGQQALVNRIGSIHNIVSVTSIALYSLVFNTKLFFAIRSRHNLNMKQFGPMQIIFVMGCQTMVIPVIFAILAYYTLWGSEIQSYVPTVVAILLPLSGMWASANVNHRKNLAEHHHNRALPIGAPAFGGTKTLANPNKCTDEQHLTSSADTADTLVEDFGGAAVSPKSNMARANGADIMNASDADLEMQQLPGVMVDRTYSVRSD